MKIAFLGTGTMGAPMARNLAKAGHEVAAWNRTADKAAPLADDGIRVAATPGEAGEGAEVLVTMLTDADATLEAAPEALRALGEDAVWWQVATVGVDGARRLGELADEHGVAYVDGPVSGTKKPAEDGQLLILASGTDGAIDRLQPLFDATGKATKRCGEAPNGSKLKLVLNAWLGGLVGVLAESVALARAEGLDPQDFLDAIAGGPLDTPFAQLKGGAMIAGEYPVAFALDNALKDLRFVVDAEERSGLDLGVLAATRELFTKASDAGHGDEDLAAVAEAVVPGR